MDFVEETNRHIIDQFGNPKALELAVAAMQRDETAGVRGGFHVLVNRI